VALGNSRVIFKFPFLSSLVIPYITINLPQYFGDKDKLKGNASIKSKRKRRKKGGRINQGKIPSPITRNLPCAYSRAYWPPFLAFPLQERRGGCPLAKEGLPR
jgi:hypothetical protein